jgi:predicted RNA-binding Zn-ribbon protein involved in translation (DUF1610 family)
VGTKYLLRNVIYMSNLTIHQQSVHMVRQFPCQECGNQLSEKGSLTKHQKSAHVSIEYPCEQCDYQAPRKSHSSSHQKSVHGYYISGVTPYNATIRSNLTWNPQSMHLSI